MEFEIGRKKLFISRLVKLVGTIFIVPCLAIGQDSGHSKSSIRTLKEAFSHALKNSEKIAISEQSVRQAEAIYRQTLGSSFPELLFRHQTVWQDGNSTTSDGMFRISKTDLTGYREMVAIRSGKLTVTQRKYEQERVEQLLLTEVAAAFFSLLQVTENRAALKRLIELAESRLQELKERVRVGRTREADSIEQEYQITSLQSQLEETARQVNAIKDLLTYLAGIPMIELEIIDTPISDRQLAIESYLAKIDQRPDVRAAITSAKVSEDFIRIARSNYFPAFNLTANYYTYRPTSRENNHWDTSLNVDLPLWDWGTKRGTLDTTKTIFNQSKEALRAVRRQADLEIRNI